jgi:TonB family protein
MIPLPTTYPSWLSAERRWLGAILAVSLTLHLLFFFVIDLKLGRTRSLPARPSTVTFADFSGTGELASEGGEGGWLRWRDPAHLALPPDALPEPEIVRKALAGRFPERRTAASDQPVPFPPSASPVTLNASIPPLDKQATAAAQRSIPEPSRRDITNPPGLGGSRYLLDGALAKRGLENIPELPQPEASSLPKPTVLQAGIDAKGHVVFASIDESSGNAELDQSALRLVYRWKFKPAPSAALENGRIRIHWDVKPPRS